jgi:hypothetical protein
MAVTTSADVTGIEAATQSLSPETNEQLRELRAALELLPESQRRALLLREWQGLSYAEIADELELSVSAVEALLFRARRGLAFHLQRTKSRLRDLGSSLAALRAIVQGGGAKMAVVTAVAGMAAAPAIVQDDRETAVARNPPSPSARATPVAAPHTATVRAGPARSSRHSAPARARAPAGAAPAGKAGAARVAPAPAARPATAAERSAPPPGAVAPAPAPAAPAPPPAVPDPVPAEVEPVADQVTAAVPAVVDAVEPVVDALPVPPPVPLPTK